jgi:hypothetical protein
MTEQSGRGRPTVSVVMPTYQRAAYLPRAIGSLRTQTFTDWELVVIDDGGDDETPELLRAAGLSRLTLHRNQRNEGLGAALNRATGLATGRYLAYLPDDDVWDPDHLARAVRLLDDDPECHLAFGGVRWHDNDLVNVSSPVGTPTLRPDIGPGDLGRFLSAPAGGVLPSGNVLALVQAVHRRGLEDQVRWRERDEIVSDSLEPDFWRGLLQHGARFRYTGAVTCGWTDHPDQRHKIISGRGRQTADWRQQSFGINLYRRHYGIRPGVKLNWQPVSSGLPVDENRRYAGTEAAGPPRPDGLRILVAGALGFNPDRILAFADQGHQIFTTALPGASFWDSTGPLPFAGITEIPYGAGWTEAVEAARPDVIYGLLGWNAVPFLHELAEANRRGPRVPFVFHFKESPLTAIRAGYWPQLRDLVLRSQGRLFASAEEREWFEAALGVPLRRPGDLIFDGEYPKRTWLTDERVPRLSDTEGELHTVCVGRAKLEPLEQLATLGIHVHVYSLPYMRGGVRGIGAAGSHRYLHLHDPIGPGDWVRELSRYDAAWLHVFASGNGGDLRQAVWHDMNLPCRLGTYAAAGLPWIQRANRGHRVAAVQLADRLGVGLHYDTVEDLAALLEKERADRNRAAAMLAHRDEFSFDHHVPRLVSLFRGLTWTG